MAKYPLAAMLKVRALHEDQAKRKVKDEEEKLQEAQQAYQNDKKELEDYQIWRPEEENRRYAAIFGKNLTADELERFRNELGLLAQKEVQLQEKMYTSEQVCEQAKKNVEAARQEVIIARKASLKLEEHRDIWQVAIRKEEERISDLEMEESRGPSFTNQDEI